MLICFLTGNINLFQLALAVGGRYVSSTPTKYSTHVEGFLEPKDEALNEVLDYEKTYKADHSIMKRIKKCICAVLSTDGDCEIIIENIQTTEFFKKDSNYAENSSKQHIEMLTEDFISDSYKFYNITSQQEKFFLSPGHIVPYIENIIKKCFSSTKW